MGSWGLGRGRWLSEEEKIIKEIMKILLENKKGAVDENQAECYLGQLFYKHQGKAASIPWVI